MRDVEGWTDRQVRQPVEVEGMVHLAGGQDEPVRIENLSVGGCRITGTYRIGDRLELTIPDRGRLRCQVRWAIGGSAGIRFLDGEDAA